MDKIPEDLKIAHLLEPTDVEGAPVSIQWDKIDGEDWIIIKDQHGKEILKVQKFLWEDKTVGFTAEVRDKIMFHARQGFG